MTYDAECPCCENYTFMKEEIKRLYRLLDIKSSKNEITEQEIEEAARVLFYYFNGNNFQWSEVSEQMSDRFRCVVKVIVKSIENSRT